MQDPSATYIEVESGSTAILPCFSFGAPTPITRYVFPLDNAPNYLVWMRYPKEKIVIFKKHVTYN